MEFFTIKYLRKLLISLNISQNRILWYALNPLVIVELSGNLHYEGMMFGCLLIAIYWLMSNRWAGAAVWWALAVSIKLIPLIFLPLLLRRIGWVKSFWFYVILTLSLAFTFLPFLDSLLIEHILSSVNLYFQTFEFNAGIYYIVRNVLFQLVGYNMIHEIGPVLGSLSFLAILIIALLKPFNWSGMMTRMLVVFTIYMALSTVVHPWYLVNLVIISCLVGKFTYPLIWSLLVVLSYSAYSTIPYAENMLLITLEYLLVLGWLGAELIRQKKIKENKLI